MQYRDIKGLILIIPTLTIGLWEYVRHQLLLPYMSMEMGNVLAPFIVFGVSVTLLRMLFKRMEGTQEELQRERASKAALVERERLARELHDGIAQSLFLLSVKVDRLERRFAGDPDGQEPLKDVRELHKTVRQTDEYVRQAIAGLRSSPAADTRPWIESIRSLALSFERDTGVKAHVAWQLPEEGLSSREKVELYAAVREALQNVRKHTDAGNVWIEADAEGQGWLCRITDDGSEAAGADWPQIGREAAAANRYGLRIIGERAAELGWSWRFEREEGRTVLELRRKEGLT
ncbi:MAG: sensor histidine kinase [Paenibacillaceae bacterium]|nr:sensor histidine kinase [Paenibacillaceae bacterium]